MAAVESNMLALGTKAATFNLAVMNLNGENVGSMVSFDNLKGTRGTVVIFMCNHCPFVIHIIKEVVNIYHSYKDKGVGFVAINSNDVVTYPQDSPENMKIFAREQQIDFPYCYDETQEVAKVYQAACTPDFYVFDKQAHLVYRGRIDGSRPSNMVIVDGVDLRNALNKMLAGKVQNLKQYPSIGCNIKWR